MTILQTIFAALNWEKRVNENFQAVSPAALFARKASTTSGLTLGYYGGVLDGVSYDDGTHNLTPSATSYVVVARATGVVTSSTGTTNWNDTTNYLRMGVAVVGTSTITSWTDWRQAYGASGGGGGGGGGAAEDVTYDNATSGLTATNVQDAIDELAAASTVSARRVNVALSDMTTDLAAGSLKAFWVAPEDGTLSDFWLALGAAQSSSGVVRVDLNKGGSTVLSTRPAIDAAESTSLTGTAAVISSASFSKGDIFTFDIDDAGTGAKGLQAVLEYTP